jgi:transporter family-2 protein
VLSKGKLIGGILILAGLTYNLFVDKRAESKTKTEELSS